MNKKNLLWIIILAALAAIMVIQLKKNKETTLKRVYHFNKNAPISVRVDTLVLENPDNQTSFAGTFSADKESKISAEIPGKIVAVPVEEGDFVKKGDPLLQIDKSSLILQLKQLEVKIKGLEDDVKRYSVLSKADAIQGVKLEKATLGLQSAQLQKSILQDKINKTTVRAPFDGIITMKFHETGEYAAPGMPLFQLSDIATLKFNLHVSENDLVLFYPDSIYPVSPDIYPDLTFRARVILVGSASNKMSHDFPVQLAVRNTPDLKIKAGMFGHVKIKRDIRKSIVISASSIVGSSLHPQVYLVKDGKAWLHDIVISSRFGNNAIVSEGLKEGDIIITTGFINLFNGANIIIKK